MNDTTFQGNGEVVYVPVVVNAKQPKLTNYDRLRAMSVEEMAEWISSILYDNGESIDMLGNTSMMDWLDWLKQEADK